MAAIAFLAEPPLVHVIVRVAIDAGQRCPVEGQRCVTLRTGRDPVQPQKRKIGQVVVECQIGAPCPLAMAGLASGLELAAVRVCAAMATGAVPGELLARNGRGVTGVAIDLGVCAEQRKLVSPGMIIVDYAPAFVIVTVAALRTEARGVCVIRAVTAGAVLWNLILVIAAAMAGDAVDPIVHPLELIARLFQMIKLRSLPFLGHVALAALIAARSTMLVVSRMTTGTSLGSLQIPSADMAGIACDSGMSAGQFEVRLVMVKFPAAPTRGAMTFAAGLRELPAVHIVGLVAADAACGSLAPRLTLLVTTVAVERSMRAVQREVGEFVVELSATQLNDVSLASLVLRMARAALADAGIGHKAVIALVQPHIGSDILVAIQAQRGLRSRIGTVVAVGAVLLLLDMCLRQFAGHQQRFYAGGARRARWACE